MKKFKILTFLFLLIINSCAIYPLVPVRGPGSTPCPELKFSGSNDFPDPINAKMVKDQSIKINRKYRWLGRLSVTTCESRLVVYDVFRN